MGKSIYSLMGSREWLRLPLNKTQTAILSMHDCSPWPRNIWVLFKLSGRLIINHCQSLFYHFTVNFVVNLKCTNNSFMFTLTLGLSSGWHDLSYICSKYIPHGRVDISDTLTSRRPHVFDLTDILFTMSNRAGCQLEFCMQSSSDTD